MVVDRWSLVKANPPLPGGREARKPGSSRLKERSSKLKAESQKYISCLQIQNKDTPQLVILL
jgi:hypothetical protein